MKSREKVGEMKVKKEGSRVVRRIENLGWRRLHSPAGCCRDNLEAFSLATLCFCLFQGCVCSPDFVRLEH
jgi:hypothetical protein